MRTKILPTLDRSQFVGTILLIPAVLAGCGGEAPAPQEREPRPVRVVQAERGTAATERVFSGQLRAAEQTRLSFRVSGRVTERPVEIGRNLARGQLIAALDATDYRLRLERAEAGLGRARAQAREAEAALARVQALYAEDNAARSDLDRAVAAFESARNATVEAERGLDIARRELGYTRLTAPSRGLVTDLLVENGEDVRAGQPIVALAGSGEPLEVEWAVDEGLIVELEPGLEVNVELPALGGMMAQAVVVDVGAAPRPGQATFPVVARLSDDSARLRPGMAAEVRIDIPGEDNDAANGILLPAYAVAGDPNGYYVFVVDSAGGGERRTVRRRSVDVGRLHPAGIEIVSGLDGGETVVSAGVSFLDDGQEVRLLRGDPLGELPPTVSTGISANGDQP